ncbi:hypothetical protein D3C86_1629010 [compost metagenome]
MNSPPAISDQPEMSQVPSMTCPAASWARGYNGRKLAWAASPVNKGTTPTSSKGISEVTPSTRVRRAERRMPPCCTANTVSRISRPMAKVALIRSDRPLLIQPRSSKVSCQVLINASAGNSAVRM